MKIVFELVVCAVVLAAVADGYCNCGCLQCNRDLQVITPPLSPLQIILKKPSCCRKSIGYSIQRPLPPRRARPGYTYTYDIEAVPQRIPTCQNFGRLGYSVQTPCNCPACRSYMQGLIAQPDRIVMNAPGGDCLDQIQDQGQGHGQGQGQAQINIAPIEDLEDELLDDHQFFPIPGNSCQCNKRYKSSKNPIVTLRNPFLYMCYRSKRYANPKSKTQISRNIKYVQIRRRRRQINSPRRNDLLQQIFLNWKPLSLTKQIGADHNAIDKETAQEIENEANLLLKSLNFEALVPEDTAVYILNTPIRILNHAKQLKEHIYPIVECLPRIFRNTNKYLLSFIHDLNLKRHRFMGNFVSDLDLLQDIQEPEYVPVQPKYSRDRFRRDLEVNDDTTGAKPHAPDQTQDHENVEDDLKQRLKEPPRPQRDDLDEDEEANESPKLITDSKGRVYVEINGVKKFLTEKTAFSKEAGVQELTSIDDLNVKDKISNIIQLAKNISDQPLDKIDLNKSEGHVLVIKEAITKVLDKIQSLINVDINQDIDIFDHVRKLKILKTNVAREWYHQLNNQMLNDIRMKIRLLNEIREMQNMKQDVFMSIAKRLRRGDDFNTDLELETLLQLDQLQSVIDKIVDELGAKIQFRSTFDLKTELQFIQELVNVKLIPLRNPTEVGAMVKAQRDKMLEKQIHLLEGLKMVLDETDSKIVMKETAVLEQVGHLEAQKMRLVQELDGMKMDQSSKVMAIFDLQEQIEVLRKKNGVVVKDEGPYRAETAKSKGEVRKGSEEEMVVLDDDRDSPEIRNSRPKNMVFPVFKVPSRTVSNIVVKDKNPVQLVSNGYVLTAYADDD